MEDKEKEIEKIMKELLKLCLNGRISAKHTGIKLNKRDYYVSFSHRLMEEKCKTCGK